MADQIKEGEDINILYGQRIGGGGGGEIFDTVIMLKGCFGPIRQVVKKVCLYTMIIECF